MTDKGQRPPRNPNPRIRIYYQELDAYASYRDQQIAQPILLPESYQGHTEIVEWSPFLHCLLLPVSPFLEAHLREDCNVGTVRVKVKADGRVKWKAGSRVLGKYHLRASCPSLLMFKGQEIPP
ncbi:hypothetical protein MLD38_025303 [Melastoma candidum]|uniref:Uncharacterized protein n=1 Tax=Melastoma candidum TaxID=119954 RepID=A0ACB9NWB7_9MYRT|nr:hypothetical protein MLD38_025303 [Melastoma candidum]